MALIGIELTKLIPGGDNGGAKLMTLELIRKLSQIDKENNYLLLINKDMVAELASFQKPNMKLLLALPSGVKIKPAQGFKQRTRRVLKHVLLALRLGNLFGIKINPPVYAESSYLSNLNLDLLFCPLTRPYLFNTNYLDPTIPIVSVIYDLQYLTYPQFFDDRSIFLRNKEFEEACQFSKKIICISNYVKESILKTEKVIPQKVIPIHIMLPERLEKFNSQKTNSLLDQYDLMPDQYILLPANFWKHKNHAMLITAFGIYLNNHPESQLKLVFTGSDASAYKTRLVALVQAMKLDEKIVFTHYVNNDDLKSLYEHCRMLVFPTLYEGFGMPVLESMTFGKPVICSNVTSLPEIVGDAALMFDPRKPDDIANCIHKVYTDQAFAKQLVDKGRSRAKLFNDSELMAKRYLEVINQTLAEGPEYSLATHGIYPDSWTSERFFITYPSDVASREIEVEFNFPDWRPEEHLEIKYEHLKEMVHEKINRAEVKTLKLPLNMRGGVIQFGFETTFVPANHNMGTDARVLGCLVNKCQINYNDPNATVVNLL